MKTIEYELKTLRYKQQLLAILIFSLVCVGLWVLASLARSQQTTKIDPELQRLARPLNPNINETVLQQLEQKRRFTDSELSSFPIYKILDSEQAPISTPQTLEIGSALGTELQNTPEATTSASFTNPTSTQSAVPANEEVPTPEPPLTSGN